MYYLSKTEIEHLDTVAVNSGLEVRQMMELAGFYIRPLFARLGVTSARHVTICVGPGNKGGDGLAAARQLMNIGYEVSIICVNQSQLSPDAMHQMQLLEYMESDCLDLNGCADPESQIVQWIEYTDMFIDALVGYHLQSEPYGLVKTLIEYLNTSQQPIISYDIPTGMDATKGYIYSSTVSAVATLTLAAPKQAFQTFESWKRAGRVFMGDLGIPNVVYQTAIGRDRPHFGEEGLVEI